MIRILVVDDEKIERNGIRFLLGKTGISSEIREAVNGVKALEELQKEPADLLLTDIKMPFMDGLELSEKVSQLYPDTKIVIFSGYGEFEYARKAMKSGVDNYILKPVDPEEFNNTMVKVNGEIETRRLGIAQKEKSESYIKAYMLMQLINGVDKISGEEENLWNLDFIQEYEYMLLLEFDRDFFGKKALDFQKEMGNKTEYDFDYLNLNQQQCLIFLKNAGDQDRKQLAKQLLVNIEVQYGEQGYVAISRNLKEIDNLQMDFQLEKEYETLEHLMENKFYLLEDRVFCEEEALDQDEIVKMEDDILMKQIRQDIKVKDMVGIRQHFDELCEKYKDKKNFSQVYVKFVFSNLLKDIYESLPADTDMNLEEEIDSLYRITDFREVIDLLDECIKKLENCFAVNPQMVHREIETVKQYIYEHYDQELSVDMLAEQVYMAPSYLSHVFKEETGQNLSKFIKALRMEKARQMLEETHNKIVNISYAVGYPNISYFCQSFREYFGVSPQKYRSQGEETEEKDS